MKFEAKRLAEEARQQREMVAILFFLEFLIFLFKVGSRCLFQLVVSLMFTCRS